MSLSALKHRSSAASKSVNACCVQQRDNGARTYNVEATSTYLKPSLELQGLCILCCRVVVLEKMRMGLGDTMMENLERFLLLVSQENVMQVCKGESPTTASLLCSCKSFLCNGMCNTICKMAVKYSKPSVSLQILSIAMVCAICRRLIPRKVLRGLQNGSLALEQRFTSSYRGTQTRQSP
jgi:hypothetical protein